MNSTEQTDHRIATTEAVAERYIDRMVMARLSTDRAYNNAENAEAQAEREAEITGHCVRHFDARYRIVEG